MNTIHAIKQENPPTVPVKVLNDVFKVFYITDPEQLNDTGQLTTIGEIQKISDTAPEVAKARIISDLYDAFGAFGFHMPDNERTFGEMAKMIYEEYGDLFFHHIDQAFRMHSRGKLNISIETYGKPITVMHVNNLFTLFARKYRAWRDDIIQRHYLQQKKKNYIPAPVREKAQIAKERKPRTRAQALKEVLSQYEKRVI